jgi:hypothetical protein
MENFISIFTASNGNKRLIAIIMMSLGIITTISGIQLPGNTEQIVSGILDIGGMIIGAWGQVHAQIEKKKGKAGTDAALKSDVVKSFEENK